MDSEPVAGGQQPNQEDQIMSGGPLEERLQDKNWKTRVAAQEELLAKLKETPVDSEDPMFAEQVEKWKHYLADVNVNALIKALESFEEFLKKVPAACLEGKQNEIITVMCQKMLLIHAKEQVSSKARECFLLIFETQSFDESITTMQCLLMHKNVKVTANAIIALSALLKAYGPKKVKIQEYAQIMLKNLQTGHKDVKKNSEDYYKTLYCWVGDVFVPELQDVLKKQQMEMLLIEFQSLQGQNNQVPRLTRKEQVEGPGDGANFNPDDFLPEADLNNFYGEAWMQEIASKPNWQDKVMEFEGVGIFCRKHRLVGADYGQMFQFLNEQIRDVNISTAVGAMQLLTQLIKSLKDRVTPCLPLVIEAVLLMHKDKRQFVSDATNSCQEVIINFTTFDQISDSVLPCVSDQVQSIQIGTIQFIENCIQVTDQEVLERVAEATLSQLKVGVNDKEQQVRDVALHCMGVAMGRLGEALVYNYIQDLNPQKQEKLYQAANSINPDIPLKPVEQPAAGGPKVLNPDFVNQPKQEGVQE